MRDVAKYGGVFGLLWGLVKCLPCTLAHFKFVGVSQRCARKSRHLILASFCVKLTRLTHGRPWLTAELCGCDWMRMPQLSQQ